MACSGRPSCASAWALSAVPAAAASAVAWLAGGVRCAISGVSGAGCGDARGSAPGAWVRHRAFSCLRRWWWGLGGAGGLDGYDTPDLECEYDPWSRTWLARGAQRIRRAWAGGRCAGRPAGGRLWTLLRGRTCGGGVRWVWLVVLVLFHSFVLFCLFRLVCFSFLLLSAVVCCCLLNM